MRRRARSRAGAEVRSRRGRAGPWLASLMLAVALAPAGASRAEGRAPDAPSLARVYHARAHHLHGDCGSPPPNSPGGHGVRLEGDARIYEASARHPFAAGHYGPGLWAARTWVHVGGGGRGRRRLWLEAPLATGCND